MSSQALYRRWRSRTFGEIIGQEHVTQTLLNALRAGRIAHAYLFSGPRGTGKTSTARVLAKAVNCLDPQDGEPCNRCTICRSLNEGRSMDLIEIDGASNNSVDNVRDIREKVAFAPSECHYKVYVIDEVHMLSDSAFNALLKTLEEPPPHVIFILATTNPEKIPLTVISRCQRFDFRRVALPNLRKKLERICNEESIHIDAPALDAIARYATGSFRDAESLLDQLVSYGAEQITLDDVHRVLGAAPQEVISGIVAALVSREAGSGLRWINAALDSGVEPRQLTREVLEHLRGLLLLKNGGAALLSVPPDMLQEMNTQAEALSLRRLLETVRLFNQAANYLKAGVHGQLPLELALVEATLLDSQDAAQSPPAASTHPAQPALASHTVSVQGTGAPPAAPAPRSAVQQPSARAEPRSEPAPPLEPPADLAAPTPPSSAPPPAAAARTVDAQELTLAWLQQNWGQLLQAVRPGSRSVEALLKSCEPVSVQGDVVTLGFYHSFHKERMDEEKNRLVVEQALAEIARRPYRVRCKLVEGDRGAREQKTEASRREKLLDNPVVSEAITRYGAKVVDVQ
jgi:DNA polymerase-3 subunit gamma/tau